MLFIVMLNLAQRLAANLREMRGDATLREFARRVGVSFATLNRLETGQQNVTLATLEKLCIRLKCDITDLFRDK